GDVERRPAGAVGARDRQRRADGDGRGARVLLDDLDLESAGLVAGDFRQRLQPARLARAAGELERGLIEALDQRVGKIAGDAGDEVAARVIRGDEFLDVVERDGLDAGHRAERRVAVRRPGVNAVLQLLFAELFLIVVAQRLLEGIELRVLDALEVLVAEAGLEK